MKRQMQIKIKKPTVAAINLTDKQLTLVETIRHHLRHRQVETVVPLKGINQVKLQLPKPDTPGQLHVSYRVEKAAPEQKLTVAFLDSDLSFIQPLQERLKQQVEKNKQWGEDDFVANGQLIMQYLKMRDAGLLTNEEFEAKKREILQLDES
ncbi:hypothetical protein FC24_GL000395 [Loigolactobacillus rennini DSM 20253]|uniref:SHOCT domain-containing protein n=2 Tax=Loigolactobacillus rennini TaxID=238013 RepID=A0A0R2CQM6_9LACO|nr:hypothetical protein FC24_GL000395 [Loigolactobacillus rennini DSM 20253]